MKSFKLLPESIRASKEKSSSIVEYFFDSNSYPDVYADFWYAKNEIIKKMFEGTNGRIKVEIAEENLEKLNQSKIKAFKNEISESKKSFASTKKVYEGHTSHNLTSYVDVTWHSILYNFYDNLEKSFSNYDIKNNLVYTKNKYSPFNGIKIGKFLNLILDFTLATYEFNYENIKVYCSQELFDANILSNAKSFRNKVLNGSIMTDYFSTNMILESDYYISILPEDFLTMSLGNGWRSCLSLNGGEYNSGVFGYISAPDSFILFGVKKGTDMDDWDVENIPEKRWRQVAMIDNQGDNIVFGREYPQSIGGLVEYLSSYILSLLGDNDFNRVPVSKDISFKSPFSTYGFVDFLQTPRYTSLLLSKKVENSTFSFAMNGEVECLQCCNQYLSDSEGLCNDCNPYEEDLYCCEYCLDDYYEEDISTAINSSGIEIFVCDYCLQEYFEEAYFEGVYQFVERDILVESASGEYILAEIAIEIGDGDEYEAPNRVLMDENGILISEATFIKDFCENPENFEGDFNVDLKEIKKDAIRFNPPYRKMFSPEKKVLEKKDLPMEEYWKRRYKIAKRYLASGLALARKYNLEEKYISDLSYVSSMRILKPEEILLPYKTVPKEIAHIYEDVYINSYITWTQTL